MQASPIKIISRSLDSKKVPMDMCWIYWPTIDQTCNLIHALKQLPTLPRYFMNYYHVLVLATTYLLTDGTQPMYLWTICLKRSNTSLVLFRATGWAFLQMPNKWWETPSSNIHQSILYQQTMPSFTVFLKTKWLRILYRLQYAWGKLPMQIYLWNLFNN